VAALISEQILRVKQSRHAQTPSGIGVGFFIDLC